MLSGLFEVAPLGPLACLVAASIWAVSVTLFSGPVRRFGAMEVNLAKTLIASFLLGGTTLALGQFHQLIDAPRWAVLTVALSGFVGMTVGDTALFAAVDRIGVHRTLLLQTFAPVFAAVLSFAAFGERLTRGQALGAVVVLAGVAIVVSERSAEAAAARPVEAPESRPTRGTRTALGLLFAVLAAAGQGTGVVLAKRGMTEIGFLPASFLRLSVACSFLVLTYAMRKGIREAGKGLRRGVLSLDGLRRVALPSFLGTYVAILLMMVGISLSPRGGRRSPPGDDAGLQSVHRRSPVAATGDAGRPRRDDPRRRRRRHSQYHRLSGADRVTDSALARSLREHRYGAQ